MHTKPKRMTGETHIPPIIWRSVQLLLAIGAVSGFLTGCARDGGMTEHAPPPGALREVRIATDATFPPFHWVDESGGATGFEVELARELVRRIGRKPVVIVVRPYERLWEGLEAGEFDCVAATTGITPVRAVRWGLTESYYSTGQVAVVRTGAGEPRSRADLSGKIVGAAGTGTSWLAAKSIEGATAVQLGKGQAGVPALRAGEIDALVVDEFEAVATARESDGRFAALPEPISQESYVIVLPRGFAALREEFNRALRSMREDGALAALRVAFGLERPAEWPVRLSRPTW